MPAVRLMLSIDLKQKVPSLLLHVGDSFPVQPLQQLLRLVLRLVTLP
jgi:hypothetical protein